MRRAFSRDLRRWSNCPRKRRCNSSWTVRRTSWNSSSHSLSGSIFSMKTRGRRSVKLQPATKLIIPSHTRSFAFSFSLYSENQESRAGGAIYCLRRTVPRKSQKPPRIGGYRGREGEHVRSAAGVIQEAGGAAEKSGKDRQLPGYGILDGRCHHQGVQWPQVQGDHLRAGCLLSILFKAIAQPPGLFVHQ